MLSRRLEPRRGRRGRPWPLLVAWAAALPIAVWAAAPGDLATPADLAVPAGATTPDRVELPDNLAIDRALAPLRADADLGGRHKARTLRWIDADEPKPDGATAPWLLRLFERVSQGASLLLWVAGTIAAAFTGVWLYRYLRQRSARRAGDEAAQRPSAQLGDLDLRPVSLPDDIGAAAKALLEGGHLRKALSLLYRGALSRAVYRFGVPIGAAATEGEVLCAVEARLDAPRARYIGELVQLWRRAVYAGDSSTLPAATADGIVRLCDRFDEALGGAPP